MTRQWEKGKDGPDPLAFVLAANLRRRHLDQGQRAMVAARIANLHRGDNQHTKEDVAKTTASQSQVGEALSISRSAVSQARQVLDRGIPELAKAVDEGNGPESRTPWASDAGVWPIPAGGGFAGDYGPAGRAARGGHGWGDG